MIVFDVLSWAFLVVGGVFCVIGGIGLIRLAAESTKNIANCKNCDKP